MTRPEEILLDRVTGRPKPDIGAEANRQAVERFLIDDRGYDPRDIEVDAPIVVTVAGEVYRSRIDLVVRVDGRRLMCIKCAAGSLGSREREIISAARVLDEYPVPLSAVSDGRTAIVWDTLTREKIGEGLDAIPSRTDARNRMKDRTPFPLSDRHRERESILFRSYDGMNVNRSGV